MYWMPLVRLTYGFRQESCWGVCTCRGCWLSPWLSGGGWPAQGQSEASVHCWVWWREGKKKKWRLFLALGSSRAWGWQHPWYFSYESQWILFFFFFESAKFNRHSITSIGRILPNAGPIHLYDLYSLFFLWIYGLCSNKTLLPSAWPPFLPLPPQLRSPSTHPLQSHFCMCKCHFSFNAQCNGPPAWKVPSDMS